MMTPAEAFMEIVARKISLVHSFDAFWHASVDKYGSTISTKKRKVECVSVIALHPIAAVESLCWKLDNEAKQQEMWQDAA